MLAPAIKYKDELRERLIDTWFDDKYKFYNYTNYYSELELDNESWNHHEFVSLDKDGKVQGFISYTILRPSNNCDTLGIINFGNNKISFGRDVRKAIIDIFEYFKFNKVSFSVVIGNPIEKTYDKMIAKYGGRIVGIQKQQTKLVDGTICDTKLYEILRDDYFKAKN